MQGGKFAKFSHALLMFSLIMETNRLTKCKERNYSQKYLIVPKKKYTHAASEFKFLMVTRCQTHRLEQTAKNSRKPTWLIIPTINAGSHAVNLQFIE